MVNLNIAFDELDPSAGDYFHHCKEDLLNFIYHHGHHLHINLISSEACNMADISKALSVSPNGRFLFVAFSHGGDDRLVANGLSYLETDQNTHFFAKSFFYSVSCLTGRGLGPNLIANGCLVFIGYTEPFRIVLSDYQTTVDCGNYGLKQFINGATIGDAYNQMFAFYNEQIDKLLLAEMSGVIKAAFLQNNANSLVILGDATLTIDDFIPAP